MLLASFCTPFQAIMLQFISQVLPEGPVFGLRTLSEAPSLSTNYLRVP